MRNIVRDLRRGVAMLAIATASDYAWAETPGTPENAAEDGDAIVVTGNRGMRPRTVADSPVPIDVISADSLKNAGMTGLKEALGSLVPSFNMPAYGGGGTAASVRPYTIRGLSGDYLLVLVNNRRRHVSSLINNLANVAAGSTPVDLDLIPTNSISRLEVLRDGAAAQYGSDAISGVLNIILDSNPEGGTLTTAAGQLWDGDGESLQQGLTWGTGLGDGGFARVAVEARLRKPAQRARPVAENMYPLLADGSRDPREAAHDHILTSYGRSNRDVVVTGSLNAETPVSDATTFYTFGTYAYRNIKDLRGIYPPKDVSSLPEIYPDGFRAYRRIWEDDGQLAIGLRGNLAGWNWDLSTSFGRDYVKLGAEGTLNPSLGPTSSTSFFMGKQISDLWVSNFDVSKGLDIGLAEPLQLSFGLEHRWERFQSLPGEPDSYRNGLYIIPTGSAPFNQLNGNKVPPAGLVAFTGTTPEDAVSISRNNVAAYLDIGAQVTRQWFLGIAGRAEHYNDSAGDTLSGKLSTRLELTDAIALRGGVNTGFRAPSLAQQGFSTTQSTAQINSAGRLEEFQSKFLAVSSPQAILLGAKPLKPEKSLNFTAGITFEPSRAFRLTVDAYQIRIKDRIVKTEQLRGPQVQAILASQGFNNLSAAQYFTNAIDTRTRGLDIVAEYQIPSPRFGSFRASAAYTYSKNKILHVIDNPAELSGINIVLFGRQAIQNLLVSSPTDKAILGLDWSKGALRANLKATRYGSYIEPAAAAAGDYKFHAEWIFDAEVEYRITSDIRLAIGSNNLFNTYPKLKPESTWYQGAWMYGTYSPFGMTGGYYYARLGISL